jgi:DNA-binding PadR family transcriptional regulator
MEINGIDLAHEDLRILRFVVEQDGASAPAIRNAFGIKSSSTSSHRLDKLEDADLVTSEYEDSDDPTGLPRRIATPTSAAEEVVDVLPDEAKETMTAEQRIDRLERQVDTTRKRIISLHRRVRQLEENMNGQQGLVFED